MKEHIVDIIHEFVHSFSLTELSIRNKNLINFENIEIIARENHYLKRCFREAFEIIKNINNSNKDNSIEIRNN